MLVLDRDQKKILLGVLAQLFNTVDELAAFLRDETGKELEDIVKGNLAVSRSRIIDDANRREWVVDLIEALREFATQNAIAGVLAELDKIGTPEQIREARFYDDPYPNGEPMVNRKDLRSKLRTVSEDGSKRILLIKGDRFTGKSHARRHIRHVATRLGIPLADFALREYATGEEVRPYDFGVYIAEKLDRELPTRLDAKASRWSLNFLNWLESQIDPNQDRLWIAFDDFEKEKLKVALPDSVYEFIQMLAERVADRMNAVRLFLINYDRDLPVEISFNLDQETIQQIDEGDISDFFLDFYDNYLPPTDFDTASADAAKRAETVYAKMGTDAATRLEVMRRALRDECEALKKKGSA